MRQDEELKELREACEGVVATAHGNVYGMTDADMLEALRMAAKACERALGEDVVRELLRRHGHISSE